MAIWGCRSESRKGGGVGLVCVYMRGRGSGSEFSLFIMQLRSTRSRGVVACLHAEVGEDGGMWVEVGLGYEGGMWVVVGLKGDEGGRERGLGL